MYENRWFSQKNCFLSKCDANPRFCHEIWGSRLPTQIRLVVTISFRQKSTKSNRRFSFPSTNHTKTSILTRLSLLIWFVVSLIAPWSYSISEIRIPVRLCAKVASALRENGEFKRASDLYQEARLVQKLSIAESRDSESQPISKPQQERKIAT